MIKSIFDEDENADALSPTEEQARTHASVLGIFGEEAEVGTSTTDTVKGPFDTTGIEMPFPVRGRSAEPTSETSDETSATGPAAETTTQETDETEPLHSSFAPPPPLAEYAPPTAGETIRMSGLAWSAGIMLFGSIAFLTVIGWFADLLIGSSPWGVVAGVVLGSIIGFVQLFRINAEILKITNRKKRSGAASTLSLTTDEADMPAIEKPETGTALNIGDNSPPRD